MTNLLRNKVILVTGSSSGIGRAIAARCAQQGAAVVLHHRGDSHSRHDAETLRNELAHASPVMLNDQKASHIVIGADLTTEGASSSVVSQTISAFGRIDGLVNNAGICQFAPASSVTKPLLINHMNVNFMAAYFLTQAATQQMIRQGHGGSIVSISSITAKLGSSNLTHYAPTKAALLAMSTSYAVEFGKHNIRYNCILPGTIQTAMNEKDLATNAKGEWMADRVPLKRLGCPDDIARSVLFFASDLSAYVTGQQVIVDGGASINYQ